jgi:hypothetical protein
MRSILVTAVGLELRVMAASTWDAINLAQALYPTRHGFSARVIRPAAAKAVA